MRYWVKVRRSDYVWSKVGATPTLKEAIASARTIKELLANEYNQVRVYDEELYRYVATWDRTKKNEEVEDDPYVTPKRWEEDIDEVDFHTRCV